MFDIELTWVNFGLFLYHHLIEKYKVKPLLEGTQRFKIYLCNLVKIQPDTKKMLLSFS